MNENSVVAKKKFGQNFLKDNYVLSQIIEAMPNDNNIVAEIGPGLGDLTKYLVNVKSVEAFEVDTELCELLQSKFKKEIDTKQLQLHCGDVLEPWESTLLEQPYNLVANLPYYIATNIILKALTDPMCRNLLVMVQLEVAQKFSASVGERVFGALAVITQSVADAKIVIKVPPESFDPMPKVDSAVMLIQKHAHRSDEGFEAFLRVAFAQPRKTLMKNLSARFEKALLMQSFEELELQVSLRPHQVCTTDYHQLYKKIKGSLDGRRESGSAS